MTTLSAPGPVVPRTAACLRQEVARHRAAGARIALVPTMGALHGGHLSLIDVARRHCDKVVVSIFVNPAQFGPNEDFASYPREESEDLRRLARRGCDIAYLPARAEIYPEGFATSVRVSGMTSGLCGAHRPGHFDGVATVVSKLLNQCAPDVAVFGEKDYQQLIMIRRLVRDLDMPVEVLAAPIIRDSDGLALSSRNAYLSKSERRVAASLNRILGEAAERIGAGGAIAGELSSAVAALRHAGIDGIDYVEVRDAEDLSPVTRLDRPARILAAIRLGNTRLIDNREIVPASKF